MLYIFIWLIVLIILLILLDKKNKSSIFGFFVVMGEFGAWKTQNTTAYLSKYKYWKEVNITNYYTGYTHFQVSSSADLINILNDIYDYHLYVNLYPYKDKIYKFKTEAQKKEYEVKHKIFTSKYPNLKKWLKFNIVLDESSILFNPRNFAKNFSWENERLLDFIYQPRKLNILFFTVVQSPMELDIKFRRLASYYRKYYKGLWFWRWHKDFYFLNPEEIDLEKAEQVGGWFFSWMNLNFYPLYPYYDYNTKELIRPWESIYTKGSIFEYIKYISENPKKPQSEKTLLYNLSNSLYIVIFLLLSAFFDFWTTANNVFILWYSEVNPLYSFILSFNSLILFFIFRVLLIPYLIYYWLNKYKILKYSYLFILAWVVAWIFNLIV